MKVKILLLLSIFGFFIVAAFCGENSYEYLPTILVVTLFRNKAHMLPYFLTYLENLDYPKDRISLWFRSDNNDDNTIEIIDVWLTEVSHLYHRVDYETDMVGEESYKMNAEKTRSTYWSKKRHMHVIQLKEKGLNYGRNIWADFIFFLDADILLIQKLSMKKLIAMQLPIVSPMLLSDGLYSNFWGGMSSDFYYERTDEYKEIYTYQKIGEFAVPMVHSAFLLNLRDKRSKYLTFNKTILVDNLEMNKMIVPDEIPTDDMIIFGISAQLFSVPMYISNSMLFGYIPVPLDENDDIAKDYQQLINLNILTINDLPNGEILINDILQPFVTHPEADRMTLSNIFMINLLRRTERRTKMINSFKEIGISVDIIEAVDGTIITDDYLNSLGINMLPGYADPFHNRPMTMGEIGCFLSHYKIWKAMLQYELREVLILEDDIKFEPYFKERAINILNDARRIGNWDLIYFGRKRLENQVENWVGGSDVLVEAGYSYWTLGYVLSLKGAQKLIEADPLTKLLPVDEFLPIMFNQHVNSSWKSFFDNRNLIAWSAAPLILFPTHYTGDDGYISDTEDSATIKNTEFDKGDEKLEKNSIDNRTSGESNTEQKGDIPAYNDKIISETGSTAEIMKDAHYDL